MEKMARFAIGCSASSSLIRGKGWFYSHFILSKIKGGTWVNWYSGEVRFVYLGAFFQLIFELFLNAAFTLLAPLHQTPSRRSLCSLPLGLVTLRWAYSQVVSSAAVFWGCHAILQGERCVTSQKRLRRRLTRRLVLTRRKQQVLPFVSFLFKSATPPPMSVNS